MGNPASQAEHLLNFEVGYRKRLNSKLSFDVTAFRSYYGQLATVETGQPYFEVAPSPHLTVPGVSGNLANARNYGVEAFGVWQVTNRWRLSPGFSFLQMKVFRDAASNDTSVEALPGNSPKHQFQLRSTFDLTRHLEWDASAYYVGGLRPNLGGTVSAAIEGYTRVDTRLGWRLNDFIELSITGQNLLSPRHMEFPNAYQLNATPAQRSVLGRITWRF